MTQGWTACKSVRLLKGRRGFDPNLGNTHEFEIESKCSFAFGGVRPEIAVSSFVKNVRSGTITLYQWAESLDEIYI